MDPTMVKPFTQNKRKRPAKESRKRKRMAIFLANKDLISAEDIQPEQLQPVTIRRTGGEYAESVAQDPPSTCTLNFHTTETPGTRTNHRTTGIENLYATPTTQQQAGGERTLQSIRQYKALIAAEQNTHRAEDRNQRLSHSQMIHFTPEASIKVRVYDDASPGGLFAADPHRYGGINRINREDANSLQSLFVEAMKDNEDARLARSPTTQPPPPTGPTATKKRISDTPSRSETQELYTSTPHITNPAPRTRHHKKDIQNKDINKEEVVEALLINCRSLHKHRHEIKDAIEELKPDLIFCTETWLKDFDEGPTLAEAIPPGYRVLTSNRDSRAGGLAIIYRSTFTTTVEETNRQKSFEHMIIKCRMDDHNARSFLLIYRRPCQNKAPFTDEMMDLVATLQNKHPNLSPWRL